MKCWLLVWLFVSLCLTVSGQSSEQTATLLQRLGDKDASVRAAAKQELKKTHDAAAISVLLQALRESREKRRLDLLDVLADIEDDRKIEPLIEVLQSDPHLDSEIGPQLIRFGAPAAEALLRSVPPDCRGDDKKEWYADVVGLIVMQMESRGLPFLFAGLTDQNACVRKAAGTGLEAFYFDSGDFDNGQPPHHPEVDAVRIFEQAINYRNPVVRHAAEDWLAHINPAELAKVHFSDFIVAMTKAYDPVQDALTRLDVLSLLSEMDTPEIQAMMRKAASDPDKEVRAVATEWLSGKVVIQ